MARRENIEAREHILKTAYQLFWEGGYKGVSMGNVAAAAGLKKANLFHYYPTKETLGVAVFDRAAEEYRSWIRAQLDVDGDPIDAIGSLFDATAAMMRDKACAGGCFVGNVAQELSDENEEMRLRVDEVFRYWIDHLAALLERGRKRGYFRADLPERVAAEAILALFEGAVLIAKARKDASPLESAKRVALDYLRCYRE